MKRADYIIQTDALSAEKTPFIKEVAEMGKMAREAAEKIIGENALCCSHTFDDSLILREDMETGEALHLGSVGEWRHQFRSEKGKHGKRALIPIPDNSAYHYPRYNAVLFMYQVYKPDGTMVVRNFYARNQEEALTFLEYLKRRQRENSNLLLLTDTSSGQKMASVFNKKTTQREHVIMPEKLKNEIFESVDWFFEGEGEMYKKYGIPYKRGILLYGNPGNGKTTLIKAIASTVDAPVAFWQVGANTTADTINATFSQAENRAPMVLVIEDMDSIPEGSRSAFLNALDGATSKEGVFIIGTTNFPEKVDPALMNRAGRFDRAYEIPLPDAELREKYLQSREVDFLHVFQLEEIVQLTDGFSFAQLGELYNAMAFRLLQNGSFDYTAIIEGMKASIDKQAKNKWHAPAASVGFSY